MIKPGEEWGTPTDASPDLEISGDDTALAGVVRCGAAPPLVRFLPRESQIARAIGVSGSSEGRPAVESRSGIELGIDAIHTPDGIAVNAAVIGVAPQDLRRHHRRRPVTVTVDGRLVFEGAATTVVIANGQFLGGLDVVPRGHPGDGRLEVQVYALVPSERTPMRRRLAGGTHLPHPRIVCSAGGTIEIRSGHGAWSFTLDGRSMAPVTTLRATVVPGAIRLLI